MIRHCIFIVHYIVKKTLSYFFSKYIIKNMGSCSSGDGKKSLIFKDCGCGCKGKKQEQKFIVSLMAALLFFIIANPSTFRTIRMIFGSWVSTPNGCPSTSGLVLHSLVFMITIWGIMNIQKAEFGTEKKEEKKEEKEKGEEEKSEEEEETPKVVPKMVDMPMPTPGISEEQFPFSDSGLELGSLDITDNTDSSLPGLYV